jgi:1-phosphofructokinase
MTPPIATVTLNPAIDQTAAIPNFQAGVVNRVTWEQADPGGKGVNVASFLADFGYAVSVTGWLGQDNPELFQKLFAQKGICDRFVRIPGKTRVNIKLVDEVQQQITDINFPGQTASETDLQQLHQVVDELAQDHEWFVVSGSVPNHVPVTVYQDLAARLKSQGKTVALDASGDSFRAALAAKPDLIKPNQTELEELLGRSLPTEAEIVSAAQDLIQQGLRYVVVSRGAQGALFVSAECVVLAQPPAIEVKSTVGAGDAMVAGTVTGLLRGWDLPRCAQLATAFSMGALSQIGPRLPPADVIEAYGDRVSIQRLR